MKYSFENRIQLSEEQIAAIKNLDKLTKEITSTEDRQTIISYLRKALNIALNIPPTYRPQAAEAIKAGFHQIFDDIRLINTLWWDIEVVYTETVQSILMLTVGLFGLSVSEIEEVIARN
jgi:hypothetical protein